MNLKTIGIVAIVIGLGLELFDISGPRNVGTAIAAVGLVLAVYVTVSQRERARLDQQITATKKAAQETHKTR